jgi:hypothetical protein
MHDQSGVGSAGLAKVEQRLSDGSLKSLTTFLGQLGLASHFAGDAVLYGADPAELMTIDSVYGKVSCLRPPLKFSNLQLPLSTMLMPYGADVPEWRQV